MDGVNDKTEKVLEFLSNSELIQEYTLIGGTALALQIKSRISEDLDFCIWQDRIGSELYEIRWAKIEKLFESEFTDVKKDILDLQQVNFFVDDVKITFFVREEVNSSIINTKLLFNKINIATIESIGAMKIELIQRRNIYRDYYDIYSILKEGFNIIDLLNLSIMYSINRMKLKSILSTLSNYERFKKEEEFELLNPKYNLSSEDIRDFIIDQYKKEDQES